MTALTKDRPTAQRAGDLVADPLATAVTIYAGGMYVLDGSGDATPATAAATTPVRAGAQARGAGRGRRTDGRRARHLLLCQQRGGTAITRAHIGENAYAADDQKTVANAGTCIAGEVRTWMTAACGCALAPEWPERWI